MNTSIKYSLLVVGIIAIGGSLWFWNSQETQQLASLLQQTTEPPAPTASPITPEGGPAADKVSLIAFGEREFSGSDFTVGQTLAENTAYTRYYITYKSGALQISGIMNVPKGNGPFPLLLLNHGYIDTSIYTNGRGLKREQDYLAREGYVVIHSDYRGHAESDDAPNTDQQFRLGYAEDVINAIHAVKAANLPYIDTERIGMLGHSMGGGVAWRIAVTQPHLVDAYVQFAPVSADERDNFEKWVSRRSEVANEILAKHGTPEKNPAFWDNISPISFFENIQVPVLIHHGTEDESVPITWSDRATKVLEKTGKDIAYYTYPNEPHEFTNAWPLVMRRTTEFFDKHVKK